MYAWLISLRYLRSRKILFFPIGGVAIGIMILILVTSVMNGFARDMQERIRGTLSHLVVRRYGGYIADWKELIAEIEKIPGVVAAAPRYQWYAAVSLNTGVVRDRGKAYQFIGIDPEREARIAELPKYIVPRRDSLRPGEKLDDPSTWTGRPIRFEPRLNRDAGHPGAIIGAEAFYGLAANDEFIEEGSVLTLTSARQEEADGSIKSFKGEFVIVDRFRSGMAEYDSGLVYLPLEAVQAFIQPKPGGGGYDVVTDVNVRLSDYTKIDEYRDRIQKLTDDDGRWGSLDVKTWRQEKEILLHAVEIEKTINAVIMFFIVIVAGFNIVAILNFMVESKTRDIGILKALGATRGGISLVFLANGILIGMIGAVVGIAAGVGIALRLNRIEDFIYMQTGWRLFDPRVYYLDHVPVEINYAAVGIIVVAALVISLVFSIYPAWRASRLDPIETIRYEA